MGRMLRRSDGMEQLDSVPCNKWVEFDSDPFAQPDNTSRNDEVRPTAAVFP